MTFKRKSGEGAANVIERSVATTFRIPGVAGANAFMAVWNGHGTYRLHINEILIDFYSTNTFFSSASAVLAPLLYRISPGIGNPGTNGAACTPKRKDDPSLTSNSSISIRQSASADGTQVSLLLGSFPSNSPWAQEYCPRNHGSSATAFTGYEMFDRSSYLKGWDCVLNPGEGFGVFCEDFDRSVHNHIITLDYWLEG